MRKLGSVTDCCDPTSYRRFFNTGEAERRLRRYRKSGLDPMATSVVDYLKTRDIAGADLLEVGGGVGDLQIEMLKAGVAHSVNVELSGGYEETAESLMRSEGVEGRVGRRLGDFVEIQDDLEPADIVVLNRVVCCYPWMELMMGAAVAKTRRYLGLTFPRERWWIKAGLALENWYMGLRSCDFRAFVHPVAEIVSTATSSGLQVRHTDRDLIWHAVVLERAG